jgi:hypothetical protein
MLSGSAAWTFYRTIVRLMRSSPFFLYCVDVVAEVQTDKSLMTHSLTHSTEQQQEQKERPRPLVIKNGGLVASKTNSNHVIYYGVRAI